MILCGELYGDPPRPRRWSVRDDTRLARWHGKGLRLADIAVKLDRSLSAVQARCKRLKLIRRPHHRWTPEREEALRACYGTAPVKTLIRTHFPTCTPAQLYQQACRLRLTRSVSA